MRRAEREASFTEYVASRRDRLRRLAFGLCGDWHRADDLVQTALVKLYPVWPRVHREGHEDDYLRTILVRASIDESRRPWRRERAGLPAGDRPDREALPVEEHDALVDALQQLPGQQRAVVLLRHWWGLSVAETAAELGIAVGTVKSHAHRGLAALQELLAV